MSANSNDCTFSPRSRDDIESWLIARFAYLSKTDEAEIDLDRLFVDYNLDSSVAVSVTADLAEWIGIELPPTLFWEYPTIGKLAAALAPLAGTRGDQNG